MAGPQIGDWQNIGVFPFQDHDEDVDIDMRNMLVGVRIKGSRERGTITEIAKESGRGTMGDVHPFRFWQAQRGQRDMGSWNPVYMAQVVGGGGSQNPNVTPRAGGGPIGAVPPGLRSSANGGAPGQETSVSALPIRNEQYKSDDRYEVAKHQWPEWLPALPNDTMVLGLAGTEERRQENLLAHVDPRLIAVNRNPSPLMGSIVCDLNPTNTISILYWARLHSMMRVVPLETLTAVPKGPGYGLAWQLTSSDQDVLAGYGLCWGMLAKPKDPTTPEDPGQPTTPGETPGGGPAITNPPSGPSDSTQSSNQSSQSNVPSGPRPVPGSNGNSGSTSGGYMASDGSGLIT